MSDIEKRIEALEKRLATLESKQAQLVEPNASQEVLTKAIIEAVNHQIMKAGKPLLLM